MLNNSIAPGPRSHAPDNISECQFGAGTQTDRNMRVFGCSESSRPCPKIANAKLVGDVRRAGFNRVKTIVAHFHCSRKKGWFIALGKKAGWIFAQPFDHIKRTTAAHDNSRRLFCLCSDPSNPIQYFGYIWERP